MSHPPRLLLDLVPALRADLRAAGFTVAGVGEVLGEVALDALGREEAVPARLAVARLLADPGASALRARAVLTSLFLLGGTLGREDVASALPTVGVEGALALGLVGPGPAADDGTLVALVDLRPYAADDACGPVDWWLVSDLGELATGRALEPDHVLGAGGASLTLAQVTSRADVGRVLDLGTGCGIQALHATRHARTVVATDLSAPALAFAAFTAALNDVDVELREGSMLEPVAGELFDLVVSNPPFVITPHTPAGDDALPLFEYRDGGRAGDDLVRDLVTSVGAVLAPGGTVQMLGNWEVRRGQDWTERVGEWLDASGLDGWVVQRELLDPARYAETWLRDGGLTADRDPEGYAAAYTAWLDDFASRDVEAIGFGIVYLRKPADGRVSLRRLEEHTGTVHQPLGEHLAASLAAHDWLEARTDAALCDEHLLVAPDVTEERYLTPGAEDPNVVIVRQGGGLGRGVHASTALAALVGVCDGELSVGQILGAIAALFEVDADELTAEVLPGVRGLVRDGLLTPA
ncbi:methyltransferase [Sanguibacter sp. HDW7]|uniref:DUF7059 domain-containing protein n=1 Tax=Sanguibacter sp. HDW7 TaxID=2714931 RepID=UPI001408B5A7|nr:methyltransferase [Sanguibacter sp. HDW7]QIK84434.1 methyltransferase [Sanguibacter sp. HDW7]